MADTKISALTSGTATSGDAVPIARAGTNYRVTVDSIAALAPQGTVTSVSGTGTVSGLTLTGTVTGSGNITLTIPTGLVGGLKFRVVQAGSGKVTIAGSGVNVNGKNGHLSTGGQWHVVDVIQTAATQFVVYGDTGA